MKIDKMKLIALVMEEAQKHPDLLPKVLSLIPQILEIAPILVGVWDRIEKEAKVPGKPVPTNPPDPEPDPELRAWFENAFHSWYQETPESSDMTTSEEVAAIQNGEPIPPAANLWLMCNRDDALWCFRFDNSRVMTFAQEGEKKIWTGPWQDYFLGGRYKEATDTGLKSSRHIILRPLAQPEFGTLTCWIEVEGVQSNLFSLHLRGERK